MSIFQRIHESGGTPLSEIKRTIDHEADPRRTYEPRPSKDKSSVMHCGQLKLLCMETAFLTEWAAPGDTVVYVGGGNGVHLPTLARLFPMLNFDVYDVPRLAPALLADTARQFRFIGRRFTDADAEAYAPMRDRIVLLSDVRPRVTGEMNPRERKTAVHDDFGDMEEQQSWVERMRPRQAFVRFRVPYEGPAKVGYLDGDLYLQPFTKRSSIETRLHVAQPDRATGAYTKRLYDCKAHEECMFHHNCVTRRAHIGPRRVDENGRPVGKRIIAFDHKLAHGILHAWVERARHDPDVSHGLQGAALDRHIHGVLLGLDIIYGKMLGMRWSDQFEHVVAGDPPP